jgi:hypothetical protein
MTELLVRHGANVNAEWHGYFPIIFAACETVDATALKWLINQGANPNCADPERKYPGTALDYVISSYWRSAELSVCIDLLLEAGGVTKYDVPSVLEMMWGAAYLLGRHSLLPTIVAHFLNDATALPWIVFFMMTNPHA